MSAAPTHPLDRIFKARSVCFVGVSADPDKTSGTPPGDVAALASAVLGLGRLFAEIKGVSEIETIPWSSCPRARA